MQYDDLKNCPWRWSRKSPSKEEILHMINWIESKQLPRDAFLEFGCGISTWYLSQMDFQEYVTVEDYEPALIQVRKHLPTIQIVGKWTEIPVQKYRYVFVDSHVGGSAGGKERYKALEYAFANHLIMDNALIISHDHVPVADMGSVCSITTGWYGVINRYGWKLVHQIPLRRSFGMYQKVV